MTTKSMNLFSSEWSAILVLLGTSGPAAILWLIVAVIVCPIQHQFWVWPSAHVTEEVSEVEPPFANFYSSSAPVLKFGVVSIAASLNHRTPDAIFGSRFASKIVSMLKIVFPLETAAALSTVWCRSSDTVTRKCFDGSAIATAFPSRPYASRSRRDICRSAKYQQSAELLARQINQGCCHLRTA